MATVLITGGTGLIGKALTKELLLKGYEVIVLTRQAHKEPSSAGNLSYAEWNVKSQSIDRKTIENADYIVHLAGANVADGRWTTWRKKEIVDSRTQSAGLLVKSLNGIPNKVKAVISSSAIGWYGPDPQIPNPKPFIETDPADDSFLGQTCLQWENSMSRISSLNKRLVVFRTGIVLSKEGGAYAQFKKPLKAGVATVLGSGKQMVSWIHILDVVNLYIYAIENEQIDGVYNAVAPQPVSNRQLILSIAKQNKVLFIPLRVPEFALKLGLGEMSIEVLKSATVSSKKIEAAGYPFLYPTIETAIPALEAV